MYGKMNSRGTVTYKTGEWYKESLSPQWTNLGMAVFSPFRAWLLRLPVQASVLSFKRLRVKSHKTLTLSGPPIIIAPLPLMLTAAEQSAPDIKDDPTACGWDTENLPAYIIGSSTLYQNREVSGRGGRVENGWKGQNWVDCKPFALQRRGGAGICGIIGNVFHQTLFPVASLGRCGSHWMMRIGRDTTSGENY